MYIDRNTAATRERTYERPDPVSLTEQAGYIPPQDQIEVHDIGWTTSQ